MKRGFLVLILMLPIVTATLTVDVKEEEYNRGERIFVEGEVAREDDFIGYLSFTLDCDGKEVQMPTTPIRVNKEKLVFNDDITLPSIIAPSSIEGSCVLQVALNKNLEKVESAKSSRFSIVREFRGEFSIDKEKIQIGQSLQITGTAKKINGEEVNGMAEIHLENENNDFVVDIVNVANGNLNYAFTSTPMPAGTYNIDIVVSDTSGNQQRFDNVATFNLVNELSLEFKVDKTRAKPGEELEIDGRAEDIFGEGVKDGTLEVKMGNDVRTEKVRRGSFNFKFKIPENIPGGKQEIEVTVQDAGGNFATATAIIDIEAQPSEIKMFVKNKKLKPEDLLEIKPVLEDQADSIIRENIEVEVENPEGERIFIETIRSNLESKLKLPKFAMPGKWTITAKAVGIEAVDEIEIEEVKSLDIRLDKNNLKVLNNGNVKYKHPLKLSFNGYEVEEKVSLNPGDTEEIELGNFVESGVYDIEVSAEEEKKSFPGIEITGKKKRSFTWAYIGMIILAVGILLYIMTTKGNIIRVGEVHKEKERREGKDRLRELKEKKASEKHYIWEQKESIDDYQKRVLKDINSTEDRKPKKDDEGGMFNMFK